MGRGGVEKVASSHETEDVRLLLLPFLSIVSGIFFLVLLLWLLGILFLISAFFIVSDGFLVLHIRIKNVSLM